MNFYTQGVQAALEKLGATVLMPALAPGDLQRIRSITETGKTPTAPAMETATAQGGRATGGMSRIRHATHERIGRGSPLPSGEMPLMGGRGETYFQGTGEPPKRLSPSGQSAWLRSRKKDVSKWRTDLIDKRLREGGQSELVESPALAKEKALGASKPSPVGVSQTVRPGALTQEQFELLRAPEAEWKSYQATQPATPAQLAMQAEGGTVANLPSALRKAKPLEEAGANLARQMGKAEGAKALGGLGAGAMKVLRSIR